MINYGFEDPKWMAMSIIRLSDPRYLRVAVLELMNAAWHKDTPCIEIEEVFDRLVQVASTGTYTPSDIANDIVHNALDQANQMLSEEDKKILEEFEADLNKLPSVSDDELKRMLGLEDPKEEEEPDE